MNLAGARTLFYKEVLRFWKVSFQTVAAPVLTAVLYLLIFGHVLEDHVQVFPGVGYTSFLIPGLVMMSDCGRSRSRNSFCRGGGKSGEIRRMVTAVIGFSVVLRMCLSMKMVSLADAR